MNSVQNSEVKDSHCKKTRRRNQGRGVGVGSRMELGASSECGSRMELGFDKPKRVRPGRGGGSSLDHQEVGSAFDLDSIRSLCTGRNSRGGGGLAGRLSAGRPRKKKDTALRESALGGTQQELGVFDSSN